MSARSRSTRPSAPWPSTPRTCGPISWRRWPTGWPPTSTPTAGSPRKTAPASAASSGAAASAPDGMSVGKLVATPELRAKIDALLAKTAAPEPDDLRSHSQRQHDALAELVGARLGDPKLGQHNGLPVTVIVTTTLQDLQAGAGHAVTAGGTLIPITDLIRMATPRLPLPGGVRRGERTITVARPIEALSLGRSTNHVAGQNTVATPHPDAPSTATTARSTTPPRIGNTAAPPTSTT